jgi:predicted membrane-bound mannosyltransferase
MNVRGNASAALLIVSGILCLVASVVSILTFSYGYNTHSGSMLLAFYWGRGLLIFPCFLIALSKSKWSVLPLWLLCLTLAILPLLIPSNLKFALGARDVPFGVREVKEVISIMLLPSLVQLAHSLRLSKGNVT